MDWESELAALWLRTSFSQIEEQYIPVLARAMSRLATGDKDVPVAIEQVMNLVRRALIHVSRRYRFERHEVDFLWLAATETAKVAPECGFRHISVDYLHWAICVARFECLIETLRDRIAVEALVMNRQDLVGKKEAIATLFEQWLKANPEPARYRRPPEGGGGSTPIGTPPTPSEPPIAPGMGRTIVEALEPPRDP